MSVAAAGKAQWDLEWGWATFHMVGKGGPRKMVGGLETCPAAVMGRADPQKVVKLQEEEKGKAGPMKVSASEEEGMLKAGPPKALRPPQMGMGQGWERVTGTR